MRDLLKELRFMIADRLQGGSKRVPYDGEQELSRALRDGSHVTRSATGFPGPMPDRTVSDLLKKKR